MADGKCLAKYFVHQFISKIMIKSLLKFFFKNRPLSNYKNLLWMHESAKLKAIANFIKYSLDAQEKIMIVAFFQDTKDRLISTLQNEQLVFQEGSLRTNLSPDTQPWLGTAQELTDLLLLHQGQGVAETFLPKQIIFAEHYPLSRLEDSLIEKLHAAFPNTPIDFCLALEEPIFQRFGGEKIIATMQYWKMNEEEMFSHTLVDKAILNLQKKIQSSITQEILANSQQQWIERNLGFQ